MFLLATDSGLAIPCDFRKFFAVQLCFFAWLVACPPVGLVAPL